MTYELTDNELLRSLWASLKRIEEALPISVPAPVVNVPPVDLADIVNAVVGLKPGPTASEIAEALAGVLQPGRQESGSDALQSIAAALEKLDFRLQATGTQAYGGGSVTIQKDQSINVANQLVPVAYDRLDLTYTGEDVTGVVYYKNGVVVATLTLTYTGTNLTSVVRT
jgi:hypothetical protein